jgi:hypothetical protein
MGYLLVPLAYPSLVIYYIIEKYNQSLKEIGLISKNSIFNSIFWGSMSGLICSCIMYGTFKEIVINPAIIFSELLKNIPSMFYFSAPSLHNDL